jgi:high-affinity iron transporter
LIIVFREVIEAGIIVGIVLAVTKGIRHNGRWIALGVAAGVAGAGCVALFAGVIANALEGIGQEVFNASILGLAVVMLAWHIIWMARHGREMAIEMRGYGEEVRTGTRSLAALAVVVAVAVMREGSEVVLFLYGLAASAKDSGADLLVGCGLGLVAGVGVSALTFLGLVVIPPRYLFGVTSVLITFLAAGLAAQATLFVQQAGLVTAFDETAWDTSAILADTSLLGRVFHTLVGYSDQPSVLQVIVYAATLGVIFSLARVFAPPARPKVAAVG